MASGDNCALSSQDVSRLVDTNNLQVDDNWDLYQRLESGSNCRGAQTGNVKCKLTNLLIQRL